MNVCHHVAFTRQKRQSRQCVNEHMLVSALQSAEADGSWKLDKCSQSLTTALAADFSACHRTAQSRQLIKLVLNVLLMSRSGLACAAGYWRMC
jgi:hypothetical protein